MIDFIFLLLYPYIYKWKIQGTKNIDSTPNVEIFLSGLRLLIIALSMPDNPRQTLAYNYNHKFINENTRHKAMFITDPGKNLKNYSIVKPHDDLMKLTYVKGKKDGNRDRAAKRVSACKYFVENTTFDYVWVGTDDLYFDVDAIDPMLNDFSKQYNTERDVVFKGHIVDFGKCVFLQGGSGWIVSRAGCRKIVKVGYEWVRRLFRPDDMATHELRGMLNLSIPETATHYMFGHYFKENVKFGFWKGNVTLCPEKVPNYRAWPNNKLHPLKELVGFHHWPNKNNAGEGVMTSLIDAKKHDKSLYIYGDTFFIHICRKKQ